MEKNNWKAKKMSPSQILILSFVIIITLGTMILMLPISTKNGVHLSFVNALFTTTSAVAVTGLSVIDIGSSFSVFGQIIILILIQLGGLGIMTFSSTVMMLIGRRITYREKRILQEDLNQEAIGGILRFLKKLVIMVIVIELAGAALLFTGFYKMYGFTLKNLYYSIFHSVSAFCNAGFSLFTNNLEILKSNYIITDTIAILIIMGGIGFAVINGTIRFIKKRESRFSLTSKLAIKMTIWLLIIGTVITLFTEYSNNLTIGHMSIIDKINSSFFQSVTTRTAGFNTVDIGSLRPATIFLYIFLMFVGASPGSTGGGIKTTTFGVIFFSIFAIIRNKKDIEIKRRRISWEILNRALAVFGISILFVSFIILAILIREERSLIKIVFEVFSAFGTVGLSMGITNSLHDFSKILLTITMLVGRVGPLTFALALGEDQRKSKHRFPKENICVG